MSDTFKLSDATLQDLLEIELAEQASWPREPVTAFRALTGDPRNESGGGAPAGMSGGEGGEGGSGGEGGGEGGEGGEQTPDFMSAFESFRGDIMERFEGLESRIPEQQQEEHEEPGQRAPEPDIFDPRNFSDDDFDDDGYLTREAQQRAMQELVDQRVAQALSPMQEARAQERRDQAAAALETRYPDLTDPEVFEPVLEQAQGMAAQLARSTGDRAWAEAWREPSFFEMVYLADVGRQAAGRETPAGGQGGVHLESGGSAGPGQQTADDGGKAVAQSIVALAQKSKFRLGNK